MKTIISYLLIVSLLPLAARAQDTVNTAQLALAAFENENIDSADILINSALAEKSTPKRLALKADLEFSKHNYANAARYYTAAEKKQAGTSQLKTAEAYTLAQMYDSAFAALVAYNNYSDRVSYAKISANAIFEPLKTDSRWQTVVNQRDINQYQKDLESAAHLINIHRNGDAFPILNQVIKKHPSAHYAWYLRATAYINDGNYKSAVSDLEQAIKLRSRNALYLSALADTYYNLQKYSKAVEMWIAAIKADELLIHNYLNIARASLLAKDYAVAEKYARLYLIMFASNMEAISILSESLAQQDDCVAALKVLNTATKKNATFYRSRGIIYLKSETYQYAIDDFNRAIDLDPTLYDVYLHRGLAYYYTGKKQEAKNDWNIALKNRIFKANEYLAKYR